MFLGSPYFVECACQSAQFYVIILNAILIVTKKSFYLGSIRFIMQLVTRLIGFKGLHELNKLMQSPNIVKMGKCL